jgi:hypothetical protein
MGPSFADAKQLAIPENPQRQSAWARMLEGAIE